MSPIKFNKYCEIDMTENNEELVKVIGKIQEFRRYIQKILTENECDVAIGGYGENRTIYRTELFSSSRTLHLGLDFWCSENTDVYAVANGIIHSFADNDAAGDYGPTIIIEHEINGETIYGLYGHLTRDSLENIHVGKKVKCGEVIGRVGSADVNGGWPEHLHFQLIRDMQGKTGDFPGVCALSEKDEYLKLCPNPWIIMN